MAQVVAACSLEPRHDSSAHRRNHQTEGRLGSQAHTRRALVLLAWSPIAATAGGPDVDAESRHRTPGPQGEARRAELAASSTTSSMRSVDARAPSGSRAAIDERHRHAAAGRAAARRIQAVCSARRQARHHQRPGARPAERRAASGSRRIRTSSACTTTGRSAGELPHVGHGRRARRARAARLHRRRHRRRGHRLGHHHWHDDLTQRRSRASFPVRQSARHEVRGFRQRPARSRTTTTATARTSPASSPATATTRTARRRGIAPDASSSSLKVLDAQRQGHDQQHHRGARLGRGEPHDLQHPRRQHVGWRARFTSPTGPTR